MLESHKNTFLLKTSHCYCFNSFSFSCPPLEDRGNFPWVLLSYIELFTSWDQAFLFVCRGILSLFSGSFLLWSLFWFGSPMLQPEESALIPNVARFLSFYSPKSHCSQRGCFYQKMITPDVKFVSLHTLAWVFSWVERDNGGTWQSYGIPSPLENIKRGLWCLCASSYAPAMPPESGEPKWRIVVGFCTPEVCIGSWFVFIFLHS